jgi:hypothetical protein
MMIGYDIYDCFTMEHFRLRQRMTLTTKIYCLRLYIKNIQILCIFQTPVEKIMCAIRRKSVFSVRGAGFLIETKSRLKTRRRVFKNPASRTEKITFPNLLHK